MIDLYPRCVNVLDTSVEPVFPENADALAGVHLKGNAVEDVVSDLEALDEAANS